MGLLVKCGDLVDGNLVDQAFSQQPLFGCMPQPACLCQVAQLECHFLIHVVGRPLPDLLQSISTWTPSSTSTQTPSSFSFAGCEASASAQSAPTVVSFKAERTGHPRRAKAIKALRLRPLPSHQRQALEAGRGGQGRQQGALCSSVLRCAP